MGASIVRVWRPGSKRLLVVTALVAAMASGLLPTPVDESSPAVAGSGGGTVSTPAPRTDEQLRRSGANELGRVIVMEWHDLTDSDGRWSLSRDSFRRQLEELYRRGYRPVTVAEFIEGTFPIPAGTTPVILTFDDSFRSHLFFDERGDPHPDSAVGILEDFSRRHPDWRATAAFYIFWPRPFRERGLVEHKLRWLVRNGYELGNHSYNHDDLRIMTDQEVRRSLGSLQARVAEVVPGYRMRSFALPFGMWPDRRELAREGEWQGTRYRHEIVLLVGDMPTLPPTHSDFDPMQVMRVQAYPPEFRKWTDWMDADQARRFVSDGHPGVTTYPRSLADQAAVGVRPVRVYDD